MERKPIVEMCKGCDHVYIGEDKKEYCDAYTNPEKRHLMGIRCGLHTDRVIVGQEKNKKKINPIKQSKRRM